MTPSNHRHPNPDPPARGSRPKKGKRRGTGGGGGLGRPGGAPPPAAFIGAALGVRQAGVTPAWGPRRGGRGGARVPDARPPLGPPSASVARRGAGVLGLGSRGAPPFSARRPYGGLGILDVVRRRPEATYATPARPDHRRPNPTPSAAFATPLGGAVAPLARPDRAPPASTGLGGRGRPLSLPTPTSVRPQARPDLVAATARRHPAEDNASDDDASYDDESSDSAAEMALPAARAPRGPAVAPPPRGGGGAAAAPLLTRTGPAPSGHRGLPLVRRRSPAAAPAAPAARPMREPLPSPPALPAASPTPPRSAPPRSGGTGRSARVEVTSAGEKKGGGSSGGTTTSDSDSDSDSSDPAPLLSSARRRAALRRRLGGASKVSSDSEDSTSSTPAPGAARASAGRPTRDRRAPERLTPSAKGGKFVGVAENPPKGRSGGLSSRAGGGGRPASPSPSPSLSRGAPAPGGGLRRRSVRARHEPKRLVVDSAGRFVGVPDRRDRPISPEEAAAPSPATSDRDGVGLDVLATVASLVDGGAAAAQAAGAAVGRLFGHRSGGGEGAGPSSQPSARTTPARSPMRAMRRKRPRGTSDNAPAPSSSDIDDDDDDAPAPPSAVRRRLRSPSPPPSRDGDSPLPPVVRAHVVDAPGPPPLVPPLDAPGGARVPYRLRSLPAGRAVADAPWACGPVDADGRRLNHLPGPAVGSAAAAAAATPAAPPPAARPDQPGFLDAGAEEVKVGPDGSPSSARPLALGPAPALRYRDGRRASGFGAVAGAAAGTAPVVVPTPSVTTPPVPATQILPSGPGTAPAGLGPAAADSTDAAAADAAADADAADAADASAPPANSPAGLSPDLVAALDSTFAPLNGGGPPGPGTVPPELLAALARPHAVRLKPGGRPVVISRASSTRHALLPFERGGPRIRLPCLVDRGGGLAPLEVNLTDTILAKRLDLAQVLVAILTDRVMPASEAAGVVTAGGTPGGARARAARVVSQ